MASDDIAQLTDALAKTHVGDGELSFQGLGLKLDNAASGQKKINPTVAMDRPVIYLYYIYYCARARACVYMYVCYPSILQLVFVLLVEELVREIEQHPCLRALCLEGNTVGVDAARAIAKALASKDMLQVLISLY